MTKHIFAAACLAAVACASDAPSKELVDARAAYARIQSGPAKARLPAEVYDTSVLLDKAEKTKSVDDAYLAQRKAQLVEARAGTLVAEEKRDAANRDLQNARIARGERAERELGATRADLAAAQQRNQATQAQLEQERQARLDAEKKAQEAMDNLAKMAALKQEARGLVITLSGQVLFVTNEAVLLPAARASLDNVAQALKATPDRNITIEGYTDSTGARSYNVDLSQRRAESVRSYLITQGVPAEMIKAVGMGPDKPVADNRTAEGRANNRRVEIIVSPAEAK